MKGKYMRVYESLNFYPAFRQAAGQRGRIQKTKYHKKKFRLKLSSFSVRRVEKINSLRRWVNFRPHELKIDPTPETVDIFRLDELKMTTVSSETLFFV